MEDMQNFSTTAYVDSENKTWMTLGLTRSGEMEVWEAHIGDVTQDLRKRHEKAAIKFAKIYGCH